MKHIFVIAVFAFALACGGANNHSTPVADEPAPLLAGPGTAIAPDGVSIAYTVSGTGSPALVFVHGWMCDQTYWAAQAAAFSETHTVVTIDLAGHGESGIGREGWPLMAFGADVEAVVEALGLDRVILIGHSMGGPVVLEAARLMPRVIGVVGVDTLQDADFKYDSEQVAPFLAPFESDFPSTCRGLVASMFQEEADAALVERIAADMSTGPPEIGIALMRGYIDYDAAAAFTAVPAAIPIRCINSTMYASNVEGNRAYHEDFDVITMDGVGHFLMIERPQDFNTQLAQVAANPNSWPVSAGCGHTGDALRNWVTEAGSEKNYSRNRMKIGRWSEPTKGSTSADRNPAWPRARQVSSVRHRCANALSKPCASSSRSPGSPRWLREGLKSPLQTATSGARLSMARRNASYWRQRSRRLAKGSLCTLTAPTVRPSAIGSSA